MKKQKWRKMTMEKMIWTRELRSAVITNTASELNRRFGIEIPKFVTLSQLLISDEIYVGEKLIFNSTGSNTRDELLLEGYYTGKLDILFPDIMLLNEDLTLLKFPAENAIHRSGTSTSNSASEIQPLNASIEELTSPSSKGKAIGSGTEDVTETRISDKIRIYELEVRRDNFLKKLKHFYFSAFEFYTKIY